MDVLAKAKQPNNRGVAQRFIDPDGICPRERETRWDVKLTVTWVEKMREVNVAFAKACEIAEGIRKMNPTCKKANIEWHVMIVHPGSPSQPVHVDDEASLLPRRKRCYYTLIIPLTPPRPGSGGTHFPKLGHTFVSFGGALVFDGGVEHAGLANRSSHDRIFLYAAVFTGKDRN